MSDTENVSLEERVARLQAELDAARAEKKNSGFKAWLKRIGRGLEAAFTSAEAVKAEKSIVALVVTRLLLFAGAGAATAEVVHSLLKALGWE